MAKAFNDWRCSMAILSFLAHTDVGRTCPQPDNEDSDSEETTEDDDSDEDRDTTEDDTDGRKG